MANFCAECGARNEGGKFCTSCGHRIIEVPRTTPNEEGSAEGWPPTAPEQTIVRGMPPRTEPSSTDTSPRAFRPPRQPPTPTAQASAEGRQSSAAPPPRAPQAPPSSVQWMPPPSHAPGTSSDNSARPPATRTLANPFTGTPLGDYLRDAAAVVLFLIFLGMPWNASDDGGDMWWVVLSALCSLVSLAVPYVVKTRAVQGFGPDAGMLVKLALNTPMAISVVAVIIADLISGTGAGGGVGFGVALAATAVALAVQPREADRYAVLAADRLWWKSACAAGIASVLLVVGGALAIVILDATSGFPMIKYSPVLLLVVLGSNIAVTVIMVAIPVSGLTQRRIADARVLGVVGMATMTIFALTHAGADPFNAQSVYRWFSAVPAFYAWGVVGALSLSSPVLRMTADPQPANGWLLTARRALMVSIASATLVFAILALGMVLDSRYSGGLIVGILLLAVSAILGSLALVQLAAATLNRLSVVLLAAGIALAGVVAVIVLVNATKSSGWMAAGNVQGIGVLEGVAFLAMPALAIGALTGPASIRAAYGPLVVEHSPPVPPNPHPGPSPNA